MTFAWPALLASLLLIPLGWLALRRIERRRRARLATLAGMGVRTSGVVGGVRGRLPDALVLAACALFCIALARPQAALAVPRPEGSVILAFDVSGSMAAEDVEPSRLELAKSIGEAFTAARPDGVLLGVVAFSDGALTVQVPTDSAAAVERAIERLLPAQGTSVGEGLMGALDTLAPEETDARADWYRRVSASPGPGVDEAPAARPGSDDTVAVVLLTDGENTSEPAPLSVASVAAARGVRVHTIGVGTPDGADLDLEGFSVHTALDAATLKAVAAATAATYHGAADAPAAIDAVYGSLGRRIAGHPEDLELTGLVAGLGLALLGLGALLSLAWRGRLP